MERRKDHRADLKFNIEYTEDLDTFSVGGRNLCPGGMAFTTGRLLPPGTWVKLKFTTQDSPHAIHARGRVLRSWKEQGEIVAAAEFFDIQSEDRNMIASLIADFVHHRPLEASA